MTLNDGMSAVLKKVTAALDTTLGAFEQVQQASGQAMDVTVIQEARAQLAEASSEVDELAEGYRRAAEQEQNAKTQEERLNASINAGTEAADKLLGKITSMVAAYASLSSIKSLVTDSLSAADTQINAQIQLSTVMGNMGSLDYYDQVLDKASEIQSKGIYGDEAMIAGAAELSTYFSDGEALLSMMDTLSNYAMGMSGGGELDSTAMVDYATGIGKIMTGSYDAMTKKGFEFTDAQKAIIEGTATNAQVVAELGEDYVGLSQEMQAAAVIGDVIDESWSGLYETMSSTPEGQIIQFKNTLGDLKETIGAGLYPAVLDLVGAFQDNLPLIENMASGLIGVLGGGIELLSTLVTWILNAYSAFQTWLSTTSIVQTIQNGILLVIYVMQQLMSIAGTVASYIVANWSWISPIIYAVAAAVLLYQTYTLLASAATAILNAVMGASPVFLIVAGILALVAALIAAIRYFDIFGSKSNSVLGTLCGVVNVVIQWFVNLGYVVANIALGIAYAIVALCSNMQTAFHNAIVNIQGWFYNLLSTALTVVAGICEALNKLPFVEFDYSGITSKAAEYAAKSAEAYDSKEDYTSVADAFNDGFNTYDAFSEGWAADAYNAGASWGDGIVDSASDFMDGLGDLTGLGDLFNYEAGSIDDYTTSLGYDLSDISSDTGDIADSASTGASALSDSLDVTEDELEYLRDIAERDAINRFTTAEVKIDMTGMTNKIDSSMDLDGVISQLTDGFTEALLTAAEGVHA
jgi:hypothetical protein